MMVALVSGDEDRNLIAAIFARNQWGVRFAQAFEDASVSAGQTHAPIILCDRDSPAGDWRDAIRQLASLPHRPCVLLVSTVVDDCLWNEVAQRGGYEVLAKPLREEEVVRAVRLAWSYWNSTAWSNPARAEAFPARRP